MKLSKRLTKIETLITENYTHIWDTCCDHGLLGTSLIIHQKAPHIHLVDIVPELVAAVNGKLSRLFFNPHSSTESDIQTHWNTHCIDIAELPLQQYPGRHLIIIAGIGGDLMIQCMRNILNQHPALEIDFLLCPVRHLHTLRQQLIELEMTLEKEVLIKENKIFYEILLLSKTSFTANQTSPLKPVSPIGEAIWQGETAQEKIEAQEYLDIKINHYQRMQQGLNSSDLTNIIKAYQAIRELN